MRILVWGGLLSLGLSLVTNRAEACSVPLLQQLTVIRGGKGDAPGPVGNVSVVIQRADLSGNDSCHDTTVIQLEFDRAEDGDSNPGAVGYRIDVVGGDPGTLRLAGGPWVPSEPSGERQALFEFFVEDEETAKEAFDYTVTITPVDASGNEGPTSDPVRIHHPGLEVQGDDPIDEDTGDDVERDRSGGDAGCAVGKSSAASGTHAGLLGAGLLGLVLRRRILSRRQRRVAR